MKRLIIAILAVSCIESQPAEPVSDAGVGQLEQPLSTQPLGFWWYGGAGARDSLLLALECALDRWRAATCIAGLDVSLSGPHFVRTATREELGDNEGSTTGANWSNTRIRLLSGMLPHSMCQVLTHELSHVLRRHNGHIAQPDDAITFIPTSMSRARITAEDIDAVCAKQECNCFVPEPAPVVP